MHGTKDLKLGTLRDIVADMGLTIDEFKELEQVYLSRSAADSASLPWPRWPTRLTCATASSRCTTKACRPNASPHSLRVSPAWARRVKQRRGEPPRTVGGSRPKLDAAARATLASWVDERPDATLAELRGRLRADLGLAVSIATVWNTLRALRLSYKKSR